MEATTGADWPQDARVTLGERVAEIQVGLQPGDAPPGGTGRSAGGSLCGPAETEGATAEVARPTSRGVMGWLP